MPDLSDLYTVANAAVYLDITEAGVEYHLYKSKRLKGLKLGRDMYLTRAELDTFREVVKPRGKSGRISKEG